MNALQAPCTHYSMHTSLVLALVRAAILLYQRVPLLETGVYIFV